MKLGVGAEHAMDAIGDDGTVDDRTMGVLGDEVERDLRLRLSMTVEAGGSAAKNESFNNSSAVGRFSGFGSTILLIMRFNSSEIGAAERNRSLSQRRTW